MGVVNPMSDVIKFIFFWGIFLGLMFTAEYWGAETLIENYNPDVNGTFDYLTETFFNIHSPYTVINWVLLTPFFIAMSWILWCALRGITP